MSETSDASPWMQQGWYGPMATVAAAKEALTGDPRLGGMLPAAGEPPAAVDESGEDGMFAVATTEPIATPAGLKEARVDIVARLVGSTF